MAFVYEPGPLVPLSAADVPIEVIVGPTIESIAAPASETMFREERHAGTVSSDVSRGGIPDVEGEFSRDMQPAIAEMGRQLATLHELDLSEAIAAVGVTIADADQLGRELPPEDEGEVRFRVDPQGGDRFDVVEFATTDQLPAPQPPPEPEPTPLP